MFIKQIAIRSDGSRVLEMFDAFAARQACPYIVAGRQASYRTGDDVVRIVFANGAVSDGQTHYDPSPNPRQVVEVRREYLTAALDKEVKDFTRYREGVLANANVARRTHGLPAIDHEAPDLLRVGKERIERLRAELAALDAQLVDPVAAARHEHQQRLIRDGMAKRSAEAAAIEAQVHAITID